MKNEAIFLLAAIMAASLFTGCSADSGDNQPPVLVGVPSEERVQVGETLRLTLSAADPEGSDVTFDYTWRPEDANTTLGDADFLPIGAEASFEWSPIASDVTSGEPIRLIFIARDSGGATTEKTVALTVLAGNGVPRFTSNASELYDPRIGGPLEFEVEVRDDDSTNVQIEMDGASAPVGSSFQQTGGLEGVFTWQPTSDQLMRRVHSVDFRAIDEQNNEAELKVSIVVRTKTNISVKRDQTEQECPGEAVISHEPLRAQNSLMNYPIVAELTGDSGRFDEVFVYWTSADAYNGDFDPTDPEKRLNAVKLEEKEGAWSGEIPNQVDIVPSGRTVTIAYNICALDSEASGDDAVVCTPSSGDVEMFYTFAVYRPDEEAECIEDSIDVTLGNDTPETATTMDETWSYYRSCDENPDVHSLQVRPGESYLIAAVYPDGQPINFEAFDDDQNDVELKKSSCTGLVSAEVSVPDGGSNTNFYVRASGNDVNYQIRAFRTQGGVGGCVDDAVEPNDVSLDAWPLGDGESIAAEICSSDDVDLYAIDLNPGDGLTATMDHPSDLAGLDLELYAPSQVDTTTITSDAKASVGDGVAFTFTNGVDIEVLEHDAAEAGTYYLMVFNNGENSAEYSLDIAIDAAPACPDADIYTSDAANHTQANAALIPQQSGDVTLSGMEVCPGKPDWYRRTEFAGTTVLTSLTVSSGVPLSDITFEAYDLAGDRIATATESNGELLLELTVDTQGQYFYKVSTNTRAEYDVFLSVF